MDYAIEMSMESNNDALLEIDGDPICHTVSGKPIAENAGTEAVCGCDPQGI